MRIFNLMLLILIILVTDSPVSLAGNSMGNLQRTAVEDIPLKVLPAEIESGFPLFVFISGDGGWNTFDESFCKHLTQKGIPVVVLDARKYFWKSRTPEETTGDLVAMIGTYGKILKRDKFVLAGFSFGADLVPFLLNRFPAGIKGSLALSILISPDKTCDFEIHLSDMLNLGISKGKYNVINEVQKSDLKKMVAVFGNDENKDNQQAFKQTGIKVEILPGNHHFDSGYEALAELIMTEMKRE